MTFFKPFALAACLLAAATAAQAQFPLQAQPGFLTHDSDAVLPNSPWKERGMPDAGKFNPAGGPDAPVSVAGEAAVAPAAMTYYPPAIVLDERPRKARGYALVAAPTLPCAPAYCPRRVARADRN
ncbi:MAG: hypothetical protein Q4F13_04950 [Pseudomonadota bacterium]|nr:hypothetical protein [Pseudomonadota bacterium]